LAAAGIFLGKGGTFLYATRRNRLRKNILWQKDQVKGFGLCNCVIGYAVNVVDYGSIPMIILFFGGRK
jgi:hypothetical protein